MLVISGRPEFAKEITNLVEASEKRQRQYARLGL